MIFIQFRYWHIIKCSIVFPEIFGINDFSRQFFLTKILSCRLFGKGVWSKIKFTMTNVHKDRRRVIENTNPYWNLTVYVRHTINV